MSDLGNVGSSDLMEETPGADRRTTGQLCYEFTETMRGLIRDTGPRTVTHALLISESPLTSEGLAAMLGRPTYEVNETLELLEDEGWILRFIENSLEKYVLQAPKRTESRLSAL